MSTTKHYNDKGEHVHSIIETVYHVNIMGVITGVVHSAVTLSIGCIEIQEDGTLIRKGVKEK